MTSAPSPSVVEGMARGRARSGWGGRVGGWSVTHRARILASVAALSILVGGVLYLSGERAAASDVWFAAVALLAAELAFEVVRTVIVDHHLGVDTIALVAMVGALALGEELAGAVIGLMFSGGQALEDVASPRARRELTALVQRAPKVAQLRTGDRIEEVPVDQVRPGDVVVVRTGEVVPVDGTVVGGEAVVDTSTLSGEPLPVTLRAGHAGAERHRRTPARRSTCAPTARRPRAPTRRSCGWSSRRRPSAPRSCGWPTATPASSCPSTLVARRRSPGRSAATRSARWPWWSSPRRAR